MNLLTLDWETFYDKDYSLKKMSPAEYILDPRFEPTGLAVKLGKMKSVWVEGDRAGDFFKRMPADGTIAVSHNALFDMSICAWRFGWVPQVMVDTLGIARALLQAYLKSLALGSVGQYLGLGGKVEGALANVIGMRLAQIKAHPQIYARFIAYGLNDAEICYGIYEWAVLGGRFPPIEIAVQDAVLRCAVTPQFNINQTTLAESLNEIKQQKLQLLESIGMTNPDGSENEEQKNKLMSNEMFADLLRDVGIDPPMKVSQITGKDAYAFSKQDQDFIDLLEHPDVKVQALVSARLGHKSTIEETRHERFINISNLYWPDTPVTTGGYHHYMPMPLRYSGAHTHRLSGDWKLNVQNMGRGSKLRQSLEAPEGYTVVAGDESQVEARFVCTLCGQTDMRDQFARGEDVYSIFAGGLFRMTVTKANKIERFIGKQCLAGDTKVLTDVGWLPITYLTTKHKIWDGMEWVEHEGLLDQGIRPVISNHGLTATMDHEILTERGWQAWGEVQQNHSLFQSALNLATSPSYHGNTEAGGTSLSADVTVDRSRSLPVLTFSKENPPVVTVVQNVQPLLRGMRNIIQSWGMLGTGPVCSTAYHLQSAGATTHGTGIIVGTGAEVSRFKKNGVRIATRSLRTSRHFRGGMIQALKWIGRTMTKVTMKVTSGSYPGRGMFSTVERYGNYRNASTSLKHVYDIANAGPRRRFTVMSNEGPVIVHNCILGLGFGLGDEKFTRSIPLLAFNQLGIRMTYTPAEGKAAVNFYRNSNPHIKNTWKLLGTAGINALVTGNHWQWGPVLFMKEEIRLPNGMSLYYHNLRKVPGGRFGDEWVFDYGGKTKRIYGGKLLENIVQALARIVTMEAAVRVRQRLAHLGIRLALQVHDELVFVVRHEHVAITKQVLAEELRRRPWWLPDLPLDCEVGEGPNYGEAK